MRFPQKVPTHHSHIVRTVQKYAIGIVDSDNLQMRSFRNFLNGMESRDSLIQVLDAYLQIINPSLWSGFFKSMDKERFGLTLEEYLRSSDVEAEKIEKCVKAVEGVYEFAPRNSDLLLDLGSTPDSLPWESIDSRRVVVLQAHETGRFLWIYEFNLPHRIQNQRDSFQLKLVSGLCIPQSSGLFTFMRDFRFRTTGVGKFAISADEILSGAAKPWVGGSFFISSMNPARDGIKESLFPFTRAFGFMDSASDEKMHDYVKTITLEFVLLRISVREDEEEAQKTVAQFGEVF